jgi:hypothetical protein
MPHQAKSHTICFAGAKYDNCDDENMDFLHQNVNGKENIAFRTVKVHAVYFTVLGKLNLFFLNIFFV